MGGQCSHGSPSLLRPPYPALPPLPSEAPRCAYGDWLGSHMFEGAHGVFILLTFTCDPPAVPRRHRHRYGVAVDTSFFARPATDLVGSFRAKITGYVVYSLADSSDNAALTYIAGQPAHELLVAVAKPATQALLVKWGVPQAFDATGKTSLDTYKLRGAAAFSGKLISFQLATQYSNLAEYAVFARAPTIEYACTGEPNATAEAACFKANGFKGGAAAERAVADMSASPGVKVAMGWGPESAYVAQLGENGIYVHASDDAHDVTPVANMATHASCHSVPLAHPAPAVSDRPALGAMPAAAAVGKHKVAFLMSDGDNLQWMYVHFWLDFRPFSRCELAVC